METKKRKFESTSIAESSSAYLSNKTEERKKLIEKQVANSSFKLNRPLTKEEETFSLLVQQLNKKLTELEFNLANKSFCVQEHYSKIRKQVDLAKLEILLTVENLCDDLYEKIDKHEKESLDTLMKINQKEFTSKINEMKIEQAKWNKRLDEYKIDNQLIDQARDSVSRLAVQTEKIRELIFNGKMLNFKPHLEASIGSFSIEKLNSFSYQIDLSEHFNEIISSTERLIKNDTNGNYSDEDCSEEDDDSDEDSDEDSEKSRNCAVFCVMNCSFFSNGDLLIAGELANKALLGEPCTKEGHGTYGVVLLVFNLEKNQLKHMKKFNVFSESWTNFSLETTSNKIFFMYQYREDNGSHRPGNEIEYEDPNVEIIYEHNIYVYLTMNEKLEKILWCQDDEKQLIGLNDSFLFFTHDLGQKIEIRRKYDFTLYIYDWSLKLVKRVGQQNNPEEPFYLFFNSRCCAPYEHNFINMCGKYFFTDTKNSLRIVDEKTGKLLKLVKGNLLTIDSNFNIILEDREAKKLKYLSFKGEFLKEIEIGDNGKLFLGKNNALCDFKSRNFTFRMRK